jgi:hypothetical protein
MEHEESQETSHHRGNLEHPALKERKVTLGDQVSWGVEEELGLEGIKARLVSLVNQVSKG